MDFLGNADFADLLGLFVLTFAVGLALGCLGDSTSWKPAMIAGCVLTSCAEVLMLGLYDANVVPWITAKALGFAVLVCGALFLGFSSARMSRGLMNDGRDPSQKRPGET